MKKILISLLFPLALFAEEQTTGNLITNSAFNNGTTGWTLSGDAQRISDCCPGGHDLEFGDSGSIEQSFNLSSETITQPMLNNGITLNSSVEVQNGECAVSGCWGGSGGADTFTIRLQIKDSDSNVLATTTQERTDVTGINGEDFTDTLSYTGSGSNIGNIFISGTDANSPATLGGPNVDNISVTMTYDDEVLTATQTAIIATAFEEIEEVLATEIETVEFEPLQEFVFEVFEEPEMVIEMFEEITFEEIAIEEINTGIVEIFTVAIEEEIIPMEVAYEEPKALETFSTEVESFETETEVESLGGQEVAQAEPGEEIVGGGNEPAPRENEERVSTEPGETLSREESVAETEEPETETVAMAEEINENEETTIAETEEQGGTEDVSSNEDESSEREEPTDTAGGEAQPETGGEQTTNQNTETERVVSIDVEKIAEQVADKVKSVDKQLEITQTIIAKAMNNNNILGSYSNVNQDIFKNQLVIDGGNYYDIREYVDGRNIYHQNQNVYKDSVSQYQTKVEEAVDEVIRTQEHLRRIRGF